MKPATMLAAASLLAAQPQSAAYAADLAAPSAASVYPAVTGASYYVEYCAVCHGGEGRGDGPLGPGLTVKPTNLRRLAIANGGEFPASRVRDSIDGRNLPLSHGVRDMPIWGQVFNRSRGTYGEQRVQERIDLLLEYVRSLQEQGL